MCVWAVTLINELLLITAVPSERAETFAISVKTSKKFHKTRVSDILDTWYQDAGHEVYFFTDSKDKKLKTQLGDHLIETHCSTGHDRKSLCCKMNYELIFFVKKNASWSCHFDDDNYVNIDRLKRLLTSMNSTLPWYAGKSSTLRPLKISTADGRKIPIWFATGGAGICLSRGLLRQLKRYVVKRRFEALCDKYMIPDDVTLGLIITHLLKVPLTIVQEFHSHLEPVHRMQVSDIPSQITFGGSESPFGLHGINFSRTSFPIPNDRLRFRDLHSYIKSIRQI